MTSAKKFTPTASPFTIGSNNGRKSTILTNNQPNIIPLINFLILSMKLIPGIFVVKSFLSFFFFPLDSNLPSSSSLFFSSSSFLSSSNCFFSAAIVPANSLVVALIFSSIFAVFSSGFFSLLIREVSLRITMVLFSTGLWGRSF